MACPSEVPDAPQRHRESQYRRDHPHPAPPGPTGHVHLKAQPRRQQPKPQSEERSAYRKGSHGYRPLSNHIRILRNSAVFVGHKSSMVKSNEPIPHSSVELPFGLLSSLTDGSRHTLHFRRNSVGYPLTFDPSSIKVVDNAKATQTPEANGLPKKDCLQ
jgi:hypothetical protein